MDIIDVMDVQNWITFIHNRIVGKYISLENAVEPIDAFFFHFVVHRLSKFNYHSFWAILGVRDVEAFIHFNLRKK